jgi:putative oxidoreductase
MQTGLEYTAMPIGRLLLSAIFIMSGIHKITAWSETADSMTREGMVAVPLFLLGALTFEIVGGLSVLLGYKTRFGALLLIIFLIPTTLIFHDFWTYEGDEQQMQMIHFMKNLSILGGLFCILTFGPGRLSIDARSPATTRLERQS